MSSERDMVIQARLSKDQLRRLVLVLAGGQLIAIPQTAIPAGQVPAFEELLRGHIGACP